MENTYTSQLFYSINFSLDKLYDKSAIQKKFGLHFFIGKMVQKSLLTLRAQKRCLGKLVLFQYFLALTSIFIRKVYFPANTDILTHAHYKFKSDFLDENFFF